MFVHWNGLFGSWISKKQKVKSAKSQIVKKKEEEEEIN